MIKSRPLKILIYSSCLALALLLSAEVAWSQTKSIRLYRPSVSKVKTHHMDSVKQLAETYTQCRQRFPEGAVRKCCIQQGGYSNLDLNNCCELLGTTALVNCCKQQNATISTFDVSGCSDYCHEMLEVLEGGGVDAAEQFVSLQAKCCKAQPEYPGCASSSSGEADPAFCKQFPEHPNCANP